VRDDGERTLNSYLRECNFMNQLDNCLDPVHATILHGRDVNGVRQNPERAESPEFEVLADDLFASYVARRQGPEPGKEWHREVSYTPPILVIHDGGSLPSDSNAYFADVAWRMPVDDYNTLSFILKFYPFKEGKSTLRPARISPKPPPLLRGTRDQRTGCRGADRPRAYRQPRGGTSRLLGPRCHPGAPALDVGDPGGPARRRAAGHPA
jgi:hypothetical protein